jgi:hypothetical protein
VYDPSIDALKLVFLDGLRKLHQVHTGGWLLTGDFNMIYHAEDKNKD